MKKGTTFTGIRESHKTLWVVTSINEKSDMIYYKQVNPIDGYIPKKKTFLSHFNHCVKTGDIKLK
jgi:hypothetical protein